MVGSKLFVAEHLHGVFDACVPHDLSFYFLDFFSVFSNKSNSALILLRAFNKH